MLAPDTSATRALAEFAAALSYDDLPEPVISRLKQCILDALGCLHGHKIVHRDISPDNLMLIHGKTTKHC